MFARTERLTLRPAWPEDAPALMAAIGDARVARMVSRVPHPYTIDDAVAWVSAPRGAAEPRFVIETLVGGAPMLIGGIGLSERQGDMADLGYWLVPAMWGQGYATEAGRAVVDMARHSLPFRRLGAGHFADNPASGRVLRKLGFRPTGTTRDMTSAARGTPALAIEYALDLDADGTPMPIAA